MSLTAATTAELFEIPRSRPVTPRRAPRAGDTPARRGHRERPAGTPDADVDAGGPPAVGGPVAGTPAPVSDLRGGPPTVAPPPSRSVVTLLEAARDELRAAQDAGQPAERFRAAHLGALRAAAAVLALRARPRRSSRPTDAWTLLASVAPEYAEWAGFFAAHSTTRSVIEAGVRGRVSQRDADDMVRQADLFLALVTRTVAGRAGA